MLDLISNVDLLSSLSLGAARALLQIAERESYPAGSRVVARGTTSKGLYIIARGVAEVARERDGGSCIE